MLYLTDAHVSTAASIVLSTWVYGGGTLYATAGAGLFDEANRTNTRLRTLLGLNATGDYGTHFGSAPIVFLKRDLPTADPVDRVVIGSTSNEIAAFGARTMLGSDTVAEIVLARFASDNSAAVTLHTIGAGRAVLVAFLPALTWFKTALPSRPIDIRARDDPVTGCFSQFLPTGFDSAAAELVTPSVATLPERLACATDTLVEVGVLNANERGAAIVLVNWSLEPRAGFNVSVAASGLPLFGTATRVSNGAAVPFESLRGRWVFRVDRLEVADAVVLRRV